MRTASAHGHAKALRVAHHDVSAHFARRFEQRQRQQIRGQYQSSAFGMHHVSVVLPVLQPAGAAGVLVDGGEVVVLGQRLVPSLWRVRHFHRNTQRRGAGLNNGNGLRMAVATHNESVTFVLQQE